MKTITNINEFIKSITLPEGYEVEPNDNNFSPDHVVVSFKKIKDKYPTSVDEVKGRDWFINSIGNISKYNDHSFDVIKNNVSSKQRAQAILELIQLVELRDEFNRIDGFVVDWKDYNQVKVTIGVEGVEGVEIVIRSTIYHQSPLYFGSLKTANLFYERFKDKIEIAKEFL